MDGFSAALVFLGEAFGATRRPSVAGIAAFLLAAVFLLSGVPKLRRPALAAMAIVDFGIGRHVRPLLGLTLGAAEVGLGVLLLFSGRLGLGLAAPVLWLFALLIGRSLFRGERFACFCFGDGGSAMSWRTLVRTLALAALASIAATAGAAPAQFSPSDRLLQATIAAALLGASALFVRVVDLVRLSGASLRALQESAA